MGGMSKRTILLNHVAGWYVEFYRERDEAVSYWYGTRQECEERANGPEPAAAYWQRPYDEARDGSYYRDAATMTGMYDAL